MHVVKLRDAPNYTAPGHEDVEARRLQGGAAGGADFVLVGHSFLETGAVIPMDAGAIGKVYVVTDGELIVEQEDGARHVLERGDSVFIPAGEARAVRNESGASAAMIVVTPPVAA